MVYLGSQEARLDNRVASGAAAPLSAADLHLDGDWEPDVKGQARGPATPHRLRKGGVASSLLLRQRSRRRRSSHAGDANARSPSRDLE